METCTWWARQTAGKVKLSPSRSLGICAMVALEFFEASTVLCHQAVSVCLYSCIVLVVDCRPIVLQCRVMKLASYLH